MIAVIGNDEDLLMFYKSHHGRLKVDFDTVKNILHGWQVLRIEDAGKPLAIVLKYGDEGHIATCGGFVGLSKMKRIADFLGIRKTRVGNDFPQGARLAKKLGFYVEMTEKGVAHYVRFI